MCERDHGSAYDVLARAHLQILSAALPPTKRNALCTHMHRRPPAPSLGPLIARSLEGAACRRSAPVAARGSKARSRRPAGRPWASALGAAPPTRRRPAQPGRRREGPTRRLATAPELLRSTRTHCTLEKHSRASASSRVPASASRVRRGSESRVRVANQSHLSRAVERRWATAARSQGGGGAGPPAENQVRGSDAQLGCPCQTTESETQGAPHLH